MSAWRQQNMYRYQGNRPVMPQDGGGMIQGDCGAQQNICGNMQDTCDIPQRPIMSQNECSGGMADNFMGQVQGCCGCGCGCNEAMPYTSGVMSQGNCGCIDRATEEGCLQNFPLGMSYVPWQQFRGLYNVSEGMCHGTIFKELELDFLGRRCN